MKEMEWCEGCGACKCIGEDMCIVQIADLSDLCPCGECIVKVSCEYPFQMCTNFSNLYEMCDNILKQRGFKINYLK